MQKFNYTCAVHLLKPVKIMKKITLFLSCFFIINQLSAQYTKQQFIDAIHAEAEIMVAHDHEFSSTDLADFGQLGFTSKTLQITTDRLDWDGNGQRIPLDTATAWSFNQYFGPDINGFKDLFESKMADLITMEANGNLKIIRNPSEIAKPVGGSNIPQVIIANEGVSIFESDASNFHNFYNLGLRQLQLFRQTDYTAISRGKKLTAFGNRLIEKCNEYGVAIDVSHVVSALGAGVVQDIIQKSTDPIMVSHQRLSSKNAKKIEEDLAMTVIAQDGGIICVHFFKNFIPGHNVDGLVSEIVRLKTLIGIDHIGLGCDFFPQSNFWIMPSLADMDILTEKLYDAGFSLEEVKKIYGENLKNYYTAVWDERCTPTFPNLTPQSSGISITGNVIQKTASTAWGNSGGASDIALSYNDYVTYKVIPNMASMVGLSETDPDNGYTSIRYALYTRHDNNVYVYENGVNKTPAGLGTYDGNSNFKILIDNNKIKYFKDGILLPYESSITGTANLFLDFSLFHQNAQIIDLFMNSNCCIDSDGDHICNENDQCYGNDDNMDLNNNGFPDGCEPCPETSYLLTNAVGVSQTSTGIKKNPGIASGWNAGGSTNIVLANNDYITYQVSGLKSIAVGLSANDVNTAFNTINYAIYTHNRGYVIVSKNGVQTAINGGNLLYDDKSVFKIGILNGQLKFYIDGHSFYQTPITPANQNFIIDLSINSAEAEIKNLKIFKGCCVDIDTDGDGVCNDNDVCQGFNDNTDINLNGVADACDNNCIPLAPAFTDLIGVSANGSTIIKTDVYAWGNGGFSASDVIENGDYVSFRATTGHANMLGLSETNIDANYTSIKYALYARLDNILYVYENGINKTPSGLGSYNEESVLSVVNINGKIKYYKDGVDLGYESTITGSTNLILDAAMLNQGSQIKDIQIFQCGALNGRLMNLVEEEHEDEDFDAGDVFMVYPNPGSENLTTNLSGNLKIVNILGELMKEVKNVNTGETFSISDLASGVYFIILENAISSYSLRFIKE